jgi:Icc-related predicted phosphoesterase
MTETTRSKKRKKRKFRKFLFWFVFALVALTGIIAIINAVSLKKNNDFIEDKVEEVVYENKLVPEIGEDENFTFTTDEDFKIMQLTDIHLGAGMLSVENDNKALNAVAAMITEEKPDLVVVTGDLSFPVPYSAGTFNNRHSAIMFARLMEKLGVYWCLTFGNHDTEAYSYYSRKAVAKIYENREKYPHCLFMSGNENVSGSGNYIINIKNSEGKITESLFMFDSHSYTNGDLLGIFWKYDCIHEDQVKWYTKQVSALTDNNGGETPKSLAFFHIPPVEMKEAYEEYKNAGYKDTKNVKLVYGKIGEGDDLICSGNKNYGIFEAFQENNTQGAFFGHDHLNTLSVDYKGVRLTYGYSIDYLAYSGIENFGLQRGCTIITVHPDGSFENHGESYYQDKYTPINKKETVDLEHDMSEIKGTTVSPLKKDE